MRPGLAGRQSPRLRSILWPPNCYTPDMRIRSTLLLLYAISHNRSVGPVSDDQSTAAPSSSSRKP